MKKPNGKTKTNGKHKNGNGTTKEPKAKKAKGGRRPEGGLGLRDDERPRLVISVKEYAQAAPVARARVAEPHLFDEAAA